MEAEGDLVWYEEMTTYVDKLNLYYTYLYVCTLHVEYVYIQYYLF